MMKQSRLCTAVGMVSMLLVFLTSLAFGGVPPKDKAQGVEKTAANDVYRPFLINNIFNYYGNNGDGSYNKFSTDNEGFEFLKGDGKNIIFEDGVLWGGFHKGRFDPKIGGSVYKHSIQAGKILSPGTLTTSPIADDANAPKYRIYRVRPDINPKVDFSTVEAKISEEEVKFIGRFESYSAQDIYNQYIKDWNEWPADDGAPFTYGRDANDSLRTSGPYDPRYDIPGVTGADQTLWYVANDLNITRNASLGGSPPIGVEMQRTIWGYRRSGPLGYTIFASTLLINKSGAPVDSMFMVQWADPDLGDAGDDFVGCDVPRSLGYVYNGKAVDATFGTKVPAGGFDFFQGPIVPGAPTDTAVFRLQYRPGFKNLPMTAFVFFTQGNPKLADPIQGPGGDVQWYRLMNGRVASDNSQFIDPTTNQATKFVLSGDPVTGTGWVDGMGGLSPADRRMCLVTGPFTMANGDTQELVVANLAGVGADRLSSISVMRGYDDGAQAAYNNLFRIPAPPPHPVVTTAVNGNGDITLSWGNPADVKKTEVDYEDQGFNFQGYNVYEIPPPSSGGKPILLATYDVADTVGVISDTLRDANTGLFVPTAIEIGSNSGIQHSVTLSQSKVTGTPFINGTKYFFDVTAYGFNTNPPAAAGTHALENLVSAITVIPAAPAPGTRYAYALSDTVKVNQTTAPGASPSDGEVIPIVVDPTKLTGDSYSITFNILDTASYTVAWTLTDVTKGKVLVDNWPNQADNNDYPVVDGMLMKVTGPPAGMKGYKFIPSTAGHRHWTSANGNFGMEGFGGAIGNAVNNWFGGSTTGFDKLRNVVIKFAQADGTWDPKAPQADPNFSHGYRYVRRAAVAPAKPAFAPWIVNPGAGYAYQDYNFSCPFSAWNEETNPPTRLMVGNHENNTTAGYVDGRYWPPAGNWGVDNTLDAREYFLVFDVPYSETPDPTLQVDILNNAVPMMWFGCPTRRASTASTPFDSIFVSGDEFEILANHLNTPQNTFTFIATKPTVGNVALAKTDVEKINVYPNPYIGFNTQEINKYARFVTFNHLPTKATIRIFNLAGILIRTIQKNDASTTEWQWDLNNEAGFPAAAGMYVVHIDMPDIGATKILKLGLIPEQQYLDRW